ncbi:MAG: AAA family ATPase [Capsulimonadaceae bacterium]
MSNPSLDEIEILLRARYPVLYIVTWEEGRVEEALAYIARRREKKLYLWSIVRGIQAYTASPEGIGRIDPRTTDPNTALDYVLESVENAIYVFRDLHPFLNDPAVTRRVRELASYLKSSYKTVVIVGPSLLLPIELRKDVAVVDFELPTREDLGDLLDRTLGEVHEATGREIEVTAEARRRILDAAAGLTWNEAENVLARTLVTSGGLSEADLPTILAEKEQAIRKSGLLECQRSGDSLDQVGGLDALKDWLVKRSVAFDQRARDFGLPAPKGVLLLGVQGCGKSLAARAIAGLWGLPLLRLDVGRLFNSLVGSSEENMRGALQVAESVAPAVLWIDEIDKSLAGVQSSGATDGGTSSRVLATFLTWLQDKTAPVFVVATANSVDQLPPELLRRGRLDETFFIDLPAAPERAEIFAIHLRRRIRDPRDFDLAALASVSEGFSGAEIEQCVIAGLFEAYAARRELSTEILKRCCADTVPLSCTMKEPVDKIRGWAAGRARPASGHLAVVTVPVAAQLPVA